MNRMRLSLYFWHAQSRDTLVFRDKFHIYCCACPTSSHSRTHSHTRAGLARIRRDKALLKHRTLLPTSTKTNSIIRRTSFFLSQSNVKLSTTPNMLFYLPSNERWLARSRSIPGRPHNNIALQDCISIRDLACCEIIKSQRLNRSNSV